MEVDFSSLLHQFEILSKLPPEGVRNALDLKAAIELRRNLNRLSVTLESPGVIVDRICYSVSPFHRKVHFPLPIVFLDADAMA